MLFSEMFKKYFMLCFIDDVYGLKNLDELNEDLIVYECDYFYLDIFWFNCLDYLWGDIKYFK